MEEIAQVYARALFEVAQQAGDLDEVHEQLGQFADAVDGSRELQTFLFSPYFSTDEKKDGLRKAVDGANDAVTNFLELLVEKHRMPAIFRIRREFDGLWARGAQAPARAAHQRHRARRRHRPEPRAHHR